MHQAYPPRERECPFGAAKGKTAARGRRPALPGFFLPLLILAALLPLLVFAAPLPDREGTARLVFRQRAGTPDSRLYVVQKGEWLAGIVRSQLETEQIPYALIRRLNPQIRNLNRIYPGQRIRLPIVERGTPPALPPESAPSRPDGPPQGGYRIQPGDSLGQVLQEELHVPPEELLSTYERVRRLNPALADPQKLPPGETLNLPAGLAHRKPEPASPLPASPPPPAAATAAPAATSVAQGWLELLRPILARMNGTLLTAGNYIIPLDGNSQLSTDCALLPVVELDDGTTLLLDFRSLLSESVRALIRRSWPTHHLLPVGELGDPLTCLRGIVGRSSHYGMTRSLEPLRLLTSPELLFYPDWIIQARPAAGRAPYRQALLLLQEGEEPLRADLLNVLKKSGLIVTEISAGTVMPPPAAQAPASPPSPGADLSGLKGTALAERLLTLLGATAVRHRVDVPLFDVARDGFQLSITADLIVERGAKKFLLHAKRLPEQFVGMLRQAGMTYVFCDPLQGGRPAIENLLAGLEIPFASGHFSFRIPETGTRPRLTISFAALRAVDGSEPFYLSDFSPPPEVEALFSNRRWGRIIRY